MQIYLPIAELPVNIIVILAMGLTVGFLSGMFGVGGGFLMTPLLIFSAFRRLSPWARNRHKWSPRRLQVHWRIGATHRSISRWAG